jgi:hypothetical protein
MNDGMKISVKCLKGHEFVVTKDMVTVTKKGNAFTVRCPHVEDGRVCGAPAPIPAKRVADLMGITSDEAKRLMKEMHDRLYGSGQGTAPLTPPEPDEPEPPVVDTDGFTQAFDAVRTPPMVQSRIREMSRNGMPVTPHPEQSPYAVDDSDVVSPRARVASASVIREGGHESGDHVRRFPPIEVIDEKQPIDILREVIRDSGLKEDAVYTLQTVADLLPDGWTTDRFFSDARYYGVPESAVKGILARFRLAWASYQKKFDEHRKMTDRLDGPPLGPFGGLGPNGGSDPLRQRDTQSDPQYRQVAQQVGMQMLQGNPMMQMWAQSNPKQFEEMIKKIVEDTLKSQQQSLFPQLNPMMGMMGGMNPMMGGMTPFGNPMMGPMSGTMVYPGQSRERGMSEERVREMVSESVSRATDKLLNDLRMVMGQMGPQQSQPSSETTLVNTLVAALLTDKKSSQPDPMTTMLLKYVLESSEKGGVTEQMFLAILDELKKGQNSRYSGDIEELRELIKWKTTESELGLKQREFDEKREDRELWRKAMDDGLQVVGQALAVTLMSRGMGGAPIAPQNQVKQQTEALLLDDGSMGLKCPECKQLIVAPKDASVVSCPYCQAVFPIVESPDFGEAGKQFDGQQVAPGPGVDVMPNGGGEEVEIESELAPEPKKRRRKSGGNVNTSEVEEPVREQSGAHY